MSNMKNAYTELTEWQDDDEVTTTFGSIKLAQAQAWDAGFAAGVKYGQELGENA